MMKLANHGQRLVDKVNDPIRFIAFAKAFGQGGGSGSLGDLTQYDKLTVTPTEDGYIKFANPFTVDPKYIFVSCPADSQAMQNGYIRGILIDFKKYGGVYNTISTGSERVAGIMRHNTPTIGGRFGYDTDGKIRISFGGGSDTTRFSLETGYIVELYA